MKNEDKLIESRLAKAICSDIIQGFKDPAVRADFEKWKKEKENEKKK